MIHHAVKDVGEIDAVAVKKMPTCHVEIALQIMVIKVSHTVSLHFRTDQLGFSDVNGDKVYLSEVAKGQIDAVQISAYEIATAQLSEGEIGIDELGIGKIRFSQISKSHISMGKVSTV